MTALGSSPAGPDPAPAPRIGRLLQPPSDRLAGARGLRAPPAFLVAVAALVTLAKSEHSADPSWTGPVFAAAALALTCAAALLWVARRFVLLAAGVTLIGLAAGGWLVAEGARQRADRAANMWGGHAFSFDEDAGSIVTADRAEAVPQGATRARVRALLGQPTGRGTQRVVEAEDLRCLVYRSDRVFRNGWRRLYAFCFRDGRYTVLRTW